MLNNKNIYKKLKFLKNKDLQINILLIMNKIRNASYNFLDINRLNKLKKFILKNDNLDIYVVNHLHHNLEKDNNAFIIYYKSYEKEIQKIKNIKNMKKFDSILGKILGFECPFDYNRCNKDNIRYRYNISVMDKDWNEIDIIYYTCIKKNEKAIKNLTKLCKKIKPIIEELGFINISFNNITTFYIE
jgi:hypothetical protein